MKLDLKIEKKIKKKAIELLEEGKPDYDIPHTLGAVYLLKKLIKKEGGDEKILIPTMYFHDSGFPKLKKGYSYQESIDAKKMHAKRGSENVKKILPSLGYFKKEEIDRIAYLIKNHEKYKNIIEKDRQLIFEADILSKIDFNRVKPNFNKKNLIEWLKKTYNKKSKYLKTKTGKELMKKMEKNIEKYLKNIS